MEYKQKMNEARDNAKLAFFQNPGYQHERIKNQTITIHLEGTHNDGAGHLSNTSNVFRLIEPLVVDRLSDVYLDSFISNHLVATAANKEVFILGITEFNIQSVSNKGAGEKYHNKLVIPNTTGTLGSANKKTIAHRATKFNFIGTLNPTTLSSLEISLTDSAGSVIGVADDVQADVWITFIIVARD